MRDAPDRHRSLWNAIAWSYELLNTNEQVLFQRMAVFVGGCTLAAVARVCEDGPGTELFDQISSLVDKHLVLQEEQADGEPRFGMLETLREFGLERLQASGELGMIQHRHAEYYLTLAEEADQHMEAPSQLLWLVRLEAEHSNVRAALLWAIENRELDLSLRLGAALPRFWLRRGHRQEAFGRLATLIQLWQGQAPRTPLEDVLYFAGLFAIRSVDLKAAQSYFEQSAGISRRTGNHYRLSYALELTGFLKHEQGDYASADALHEEGLALSYQVADKFGIAMTLSRRGRMLAERGRLAEGRQLCEQALALHREIGDKWGIALALRNLGLVRRLQGDFVEAQSLFERTFRLSQELGDKSTIAQAQYDLGCVRLDQGDLATGQQLLREALNTYFQMDSRSNIADTLDALARVAAARNQPERTLRLAGAAAAIRAAVGFVRAPLLQAEVNQVLQAARLMLNEEAGTTAWAEGEMMTIEEAVAYTLAV
jgi:tetratricopeptide (TPR) repeat protein